MSIWQIQTSGENYKYLKLVNKEAAWIETNWYTWFDGSSLLEKWSSSEIHVEESPKGIAGDFPPLTASAIVCSERAANILRPMLNSSAELLPLKGNKEKYFLINVTCVIDCLDMERSILQRFASSNRIMRVLHYAWKSDCLGNTEIFKLPEFVRSYHFVTDKFKQVVESHNLRGLTFLPTE